MTWTLLAAVTAACIAVGSCALWLPDRTPTLLSSAGERTVVPASVQEYAGTQQVTVVPTISSDRDLFGNASGLVTADWSGNGLTSGKGAYQVNDRTVVALNTATPLYRDLKTGDIGGDVLALNNELSLLGYNSVPGSDTYWRATSDGWKQLMADNGNTSDGSLSLADTLWIPEHEVAVDEWSATAGSMVTGGTAIGKIPGSLTKLTIKNGTASAQDRTLTIFGITGTLPANTTEITDAGFLQQVEANDSYQSVDVESKKSGIGRHSGLERTDASAARSSRCGIRHQRFNRLHRAHIQQSWQHSRESVDRGRRTWREPRASRQRRHRFDLQCGNRQRT
ncbi:hypothetical protein [Bifidobacterium pseudocatenulatum]|uniref:hypothetical protein n=1 Tax=Bifidobacterium pseudocatenulatum TaxID=28026 RepID=UPI001F52F548|nr:hypothetical protein [Bifidobacterium pseudocatenulatum]